MFSHSVLNDYRFTENSKFLFLFVPFEFQIPFLCSTYSIVTMSSHCVLNDQVYREQQGFIISILFPVSCLILNFLVVPFKFRSHLSSLPTAQLLCPLLSSPLYVINFFWFALFLLKFRSHKIPYFVKFLLHVALIILYNTYLKSTYFVTNFYCSILSV